MNSPHGQGLEGNRRLPGEEEDRSNGMLIAGPHGILVTFDRRMRIR